MESEQDFKSILKNMIYEALETALHEEPLGEETSETDVENVAKNISDLYGTPYEIELDKLLQARS